MVLTYNSVKFTSFVTQWFPCLRGLILACAELAEVFGGFGVGVAEEVEFYAA